ncbi:MAG: FixH family protein [Chloroflexi bacterium]|nr:FixH family protein [Chloroflexota bacterium]
MNRKTILLIVVAVFAIACIAFSIAFLMMPQFSYALLGIGAPAQAQGSGPGYGRGMMGGADNSGTPVAPGTPPAGYGPGGMMGRGRMGGQGQPPVADPNLKTVEMKSDTASQKVGNTNVTFTLAPYPPVGFRQSTFDIALTDEKGAAIKDAKVSFDLTMPAMWMPSNKPVAQAVGDGKYRATGMFTMRGFWRIEVIIERGGEKQSAFLDLWM